MAKPNNWVPIEGYPHYEVSDGGAVRNLKTERILKPMLTGSKRRQYQVVRLSTTPRVDRKVHVLVLEAFVGPRPKGMLGCHKDDDQNNNSLSNLEWGTPSHNARTAADGVNRQRVLDMRACEVKNKDIAGWFGISPQRACDLAKGR